MNTLTTEQEQEIIRHYLKNTKKKIIKRIYNITDGQFSRIVRISILKEENKKQMALTSEHYL